MTAPADTTAATGLVLVFDVPGELWLSSNRMPTNRKHLHRIAQGLHDLAGWAARAQRARPVVGPVRVVWAVHYAHGTGSADPANAQPATKRLLDGLVKVGVLVDDDSSRVRAETFVRGPNLPRVARRPGLPTRRITLTITEEKP